MLLLICGPVLWNVAAAGSTPPASPRSYAYSIVQVYPHSPQDFTQGLVYADGRLYESTGIYGASALLVKAVESGAVLNRIDLSAQYFAEGLTLAGDELVQLTYREQTGFVYDRTSLKILRTFPYVGEGWGLTYNGHHLIMSDGSEHLYFVDPKTYRRKRSLTVSFAGKEVHAINELEYFNGKIYANIWRQPDIIEIDPATGNVTGKIDLSALARQHAGAESVLNGIAYNPERGTLYVTGKLWPSLYEIKLQPPPGSN
ncbi:MAG TPA: glutaminyl-peptide cyclotransferase [Gammaproteobacteria bacterium]